MFIHYICKEQKIAYGPKYSKKHLILPLLHKIKPKKLFMQKAFIQCPQKVTRHSNSNACDVSQLPCFFFVAQKLNQSPSFSMTRILHDSPKKNQFIGAVQGGNFVPIAAASFRIPHSTGYKLWNKWAHAAPKVHKVRKKPFPKWRKSTYEPCGPI